MNLADQVQKEIDALFSIPKDHGEPEPIEIAIIQALATYRLSQAVMAVAERLEHPLREVKGAEAWGDGGPPCMVCSNPVRIDQDARKHPDGTWTHYVCSSRNTA